ncbi:L-idonate 5-dehydrogenase [Polycladidibacter stylochi]|uniref:L-idonate 5-dehydrogenase n=1 Tax=Polycladidibacter stylochi TaxID=1807766 RepID=UPI00138F78E1|nr:L-idonate 5-dehydrogenase [Pseudovibrio stylochi]
MSQQNSGFIIKSADKKGIANIEMPMLGKQDVLIKMAAVGICGSDIHYYKEGACGAFAIQQPFTPGHEACGYVEALGGDVIGLARGDLVAINPSRPCGSCSHCVNGEAHLCLNNGFMGSASRFPHSQGMMRRYFSVGAFQCTKVDSQVQVETLALIEPFSVALHAVAQAGPLLGKTVMVSGGGTIGLLVALGAQKAGALKVVLSDPTPHARNIAKRLGIDAQLDSFLSLESKQEALGHIDVCFEAAGVEASLADCIELVARRGSIVQVGTLPQMQGRANINAIMTKELSYKGSMRFDKEFATALDWVVNRKVDLSPLVSKIVPLQKAQEGFEAALASNVTKVIVTAE